MGNAAAYADALFELAQEEGLSDRILEEIMKVKAILLENEQYVKLLSAHSIPVGERLSAARAAFSQVHDYLRNTLLILVEKGRAGELCSFASDFRARYNSENGIIDATAYCAAPMSDEQQKRLRERLEQQLGKRVLLQVKQDAGLIGGVKLELPGMLLDGTLSGRLDAIKAQLMSAHY